jgi:SNF2-related domain
MVSHYLLVEFIYIIIIKLNIDMGLGKTIQSIAFLSAIVGEQIAEITFFKNKKRSYECKNNFKPALIVLPAGVIQQWMREFKKVFFISFFFLPTIIFTREFQWGRWRVAVFHGKDRNCILRNPRHTFNIGKQLSFDCIL